jgi:hypothetical protein
MMIVLSIIEIVYGALVDAAGHEETRSLGKSKIHFSRRLKGRQSTTQRDPV